MDGSGKKKISWRQGPDDQDDLDGEEVLKSESSSSQSSGGSGSSSTSDDVDKEEGVGEDKGKEVRNGDVGRRGEWRNEVVRRPLERVREEDESSVDREEIWAPPESEDYTSGGGGGEGYHQRRRSSQQEEAQRLIRSRFRKSLDIPGRVAPSLWITKDDIRHQTLPILWQPVWTCKSVGRLLLVLSIITMLLALFLFFVEMGAQEHRFEFGEECKNSRNYLRLIRTVCTFCGGAVNPHCSKVIRIPEDMKTPVFLYYELVRFHQNHRKICGSYDASQMIGKIFDSEGNPVKPSETCGAFSTDANGKIYFPCGQLANLMYNDDFSLATGNGDMVPFRTHGIAHTALKYFRYKNPPGITPKNYMYKQFFMDNFVKPKDWTKDQWQQWWNEGGMENERFINWMNPSALAHLRKLYAVIDNVPSCNSGVLCKGNYTMNIEYRYDMDRFGGSKAFVLATTTYFGGENNKLVLLIVIVGVVELVLGLLMLQLDHMAKHINNRRRSSVDRQRRSTADKTMKVIHHPPPPPPPPPTPQSARASVAAVTKIPVTSFSDPGITTSATTAEGLKTGTNAAEQFSTLYQNPISPHESHEILSPEIFYETDPGIDFTTEEEAEEDEAGEESESSSSSSTNSSDSYTSVNSNLVSADAGESSSSDEQANNENRTDNNRLRKRR